MVFYFCRSTFVNEPEHVQYEYLAGPPQLSDSTPPLTTPGQGVQQEVILDNLIASNQVSCQESAQEFKRTPVSKRTLSSFRKIYKKQDTAAALDLLMARSEVVIDDKWKVDASDPNLFIHVEDANVDYILMVNSKCGFGCVLPRDESIEHSFQLVFSGQNRIWKCNKGTLGFPAKGAMLYIGESPNEHIWLGMAPNAFLDNPGPLPTTPGSEGGDPRLEEHHYLALVMMFAFFLHQMGFGGVTCHETYPALTREDVRHATNIL